MNLAARIVSAATGDGVEPLLDGIIDRLGAPPEEKQAEPQAQGDWSPL